LKEKIALAKDAMDAKILPTDWIYDNIFHLSEDQYTEYRDLIVQDQKRAFRTNQIATEGNDPLESGKSYGTPHDLAFLYGKGRMGSNPENLPAGYDENIPLGRPGEKASNINTQDNAFGRDRLGVKDMKVDDQPGYGKINYKGGSPLALESTTYFNQNKVLLEGMEKKLNLFKEEQSASSLLDESNIKED
jgi:hypothetical protein